MLRRRLSAAGARTNGVVQRGRRRRDGEAADRRRARRIDANNAKDWHTWQALHTEKAVRTAPELGEPFGGAKASRVLPSVPVRQFVLSFPYELSGLAATRPDVLASLCCIFGEALALHYRTWAKSAGYTGAQTGAVTFVHRFGSSLKAHTHFHVVEDVEVDMHVEARARAVHPRHRARLRARRRVPRALGPA